MPTFDTDHTTTRPPTFPRTPLLPLGAMLFGATLAATPAAAAGDDTTLPTVQVKEQSLREQQGYQGGKTRLGKTEQLAQEMPQSVTILSEELLFETNADTLKDALRNVAGLTYNAGEGGRIGDNMMLRGFYSFGDLYLDGIRDVAQYNRETFNVEQIEVLRGSAAMLFGRGQAGGVINRSTKQPILVDRSSLTTTLGSDDYGRITGDFNKVLGDHSAMRINVMKTEGGSTRDAVRTNREGIAPAFRWGIGTDDDVQIDAFYLKTHNVPDYGVPFYNREPLDVDASTFYGTSSDYEDNETTMLTGTWKHRFSNAAELRTVLRAADYQRDLWAVAPRLSGATDASVADGSATITRGRQARGGEEHTLTLQSDLSTRFATAGLQHEALAGIELLRENATRWSYNSDADAIAPATTVGNRDHNPLLPDGYGNTVKNNAASYMGRTVAVYGQDIVEFLPGWKILGGLRRDYLDADYSNGASVDYAQTSYRAALSWQPDDYAHYYLAWSDSFSPTADLYQFSSSSAKYPAERSKSLELGAKWELFDGDLSLRAAVYHAVKEWERNTDVDSAGSAQLLSKKRHTNGIEIEAAGRITAAWEVFFGWTVMDAEIDEEAPGQNPYLAGMRPRNTPPYAWNLWTTYRLAEAWKVGGGIEAKGARYAYRLGSGSSPVTPNVAPGYQRVDLMLAYEQPKYTIKANLLNALDKRYYAAVYENGGFAIPGTERALQVTAEYRF